MSNKIWRLVVGLLCTLAGCAEITPPTHTFMLTPVSFSDLTGWENDSFSEALTSFLHSCGDWEHKPQNGSRGIAGNIAAWKAVCAQARQVTMGDTPGARTFFELNFNPYATAGQEGSSGLFTGYYAPELRGALQPGGPFQTPLYARPGDLLTADLGAFKADLKGQSIVGKIDGSHFVPYDDRAAIAAGHLEARAKPLVWVDDPVAAFFLEVQGSGRIRLSDGSMMPLGYDGANGRAYVAIGKILADRGNLPRPVTMPAIRSWLQAHPDQSRDILNTNPSYVFFRRLPNDDVIGAEGVALTAGHSLAVDPTFVPLGVPVWLDTLDGKGQNLRRLLVAQDTGGAIKGAVRGDVFWGQGEEAERQAGAMQGHGRYYLLLPKSVEVN